MYSVRTYNSLILFSIAITLFMGFWYVWVGGGFGLLALPMAIPFFIAPAIIYSLQLRRQNDRYALLLLPLVTYEFLYVILNIVRLVTTHYGANLDLHSSNVSLLGVAIPISLYSWFSIWSGPLPLFILLMLVHSITLSAGYTRIFWKQFILPYLLLLATILFTIVAIKYYSSAIKPEQWEEFSSAVCHYSIKMHPAIKPSFGDSFGYQSSASTDPYDCTDQFHYYGSGQNARLNVNLYPNSYETLPSWLLDGWTHASTLPFSGGVGLPLIQSTDEWHYADKTPWKSYFKKEVEKLIPTGTKLTVDGHEALEFQKPDTIILFISNPNKQVAELQCQGDGVIITTEICREMLRSFSFEK